MQRLLVTALGVGLGVASLGGSALAQEAPTSGLITNADGSYVTASDSGVSSADGSGQNVIYGDITTLPGIVVIGAPPPPPPPSDGGGGNGGGGGGGGNGGGGGGGGGATAVPTATDQDADNVADELEPGLGLTVGNADTDGDGLADGDEINIYGTNPTIFDSDGDGRGDGNEVFWTNTDPLVADAAPAEPAPQSFQTQGGPTAPAGDGTVLAAESGDASSVGPGSASAAPGTLLTGVADETGTVTTVAGPVVNESRQTPGSITTTSAPAPPAPAETLPAETAPLAGAAAPVEASSSCGSYGGWYDAQLAYEAAGGLTGSAELIGAFDPDGDGIACESLM